MLIYAFLLILLLRPSWGLWGLFSVIAYVMFALGGVQAGLDPVSMSVAAGTEGTIFCALGAVIVFVRLKFKNRASRQDKDVDQELARVRAEAAARESQTPTQ